MKFIRYRIIYAILPLIICCLLGSCANSQPPSGGPPDKEPPEVNEFSPQNGTLNFHDETITLHFTEYVNKSRVSENIFISPNKRLEYSWSGRELEVTIAEPLDSNTTYSFTLGTEYADLAGNKPTQAFTVIFSTGSHLDSGIIRGKLTADAPSGVYVFLYPITGINPDTLNPAHTKPKYRTQVGTNGAFEFRALPEGRYRMFAIKDEYKDELYDISLDAYGTAEDDITLRQDSIPTVNIRLGEIRDVITPQLFDVRASRTLLEAQFSKNIDTNFIMRENFSVRDSASTKIIPVKSVWIHPKNGKSVMIQTSTPLDTVTHWRLSVRLGDSTIRDIAGNKIVDSASSRIFTATSDVTDTLPPIILQFPFADSSKGVALSSAFDFVFDRAVVQDDVERNLVFTNVSTNKTVVADYRWRGDNILRIQPEQRLESDSWYELKLNIGAIHSIGGGKAAKDSVKLIRFKSFDSRTFGGIKGVLTDSSGSDKERYVVTLVSKDKKTRLTQVLTSAGAFEFAEVQPGIYTLEVFVDNGTGKYDVGAVYPFRPAARFGVGTTEITVRSRWTVEGAKIDIGK
ncbi:MAG: Ig-like domain-containing protein [Ignavibacteriae bacterium]|nr:Ig-like domain-containing protein [Ignavibacteriota bacterium]